MTMKYMRWDDSEVLKEFSRLMEEKDGLKKMAEDTSAHAAETQNKEAAVPSMSLNAKIAAEGKHYDVTPKEDLVHEAHPQTAKVSGDTVENLNEQQKADLEVAQKSAKEVLTELYKMAKQLKAEGKDEAYELVKGTIVDIAKELK